MINIVTFTGVDARTDMGMLRELAEEYPLAEFGVLVGSHSGEEDFGIFPSLEVVEELGKSGVRSSLHLCGRWARAVVSKDLVGSPNVLSLDVARLASRAYELGGMFNRVQVNLHGDELDPSAIDVYEKRIVHFVENVGAERVILQHRSGWDDVPVRHPKLEYLFDLSEGGGVESFEDWPEPPENGDMVGYAGGLGPYNIDSALAFAVCYPEAPLWLDMEGRIRSEGCFDLDKVRAVCEKVWTAESFADVPW